MKLTSMTHWIVGAALATSFNAFAQDAMKTAPMAKKDMAMQDCKDRMTTAKGEKRNEAPVNGDIDKACADMMKSHRGKMMNKSTAPMNEPGATKEKSAN